MERFCVPREVLASRPNEAILIARAGVAANAILSVASMSASTMAVGVGRERDILQALLLMLSYLKEAADVVDNRLARELAAAGAAAGYPSPRPISELQSVFSRGEGSLYRRLAIAIRSKKAFHIDKDGDSHFHEWLKQVQEPYFSPEITLWRKDSAKPIDWAFTVSAEIQSFFGARIDEDSIRVLKDAPGIVFLVEAMACGMLARAGIDPRTGFRRTVRRQVRIEYQFGGRRPAINETVAMTVDASGDPTGTISELRDRVTEVLGGPRAGAVVPGSAMDSQSDADVALQNPNGTAKAWFGPRVEDDAGGERERFTVIRIQDMARWGKEVTRRALEFAQSVHQGRAMPHDVATFIASLQQDLVYWEKEVAYAESLRDSGVVKMFR
ncbi:MAG TPA: hypothetical protein VF198_13495 [Vicinamibacterales bacterium]